MNRTASNITAAVFAAVLSTGIAVARPSSAPQPTDLTPKFRSAGLAINGLQAFEIGGVVVLRGRATDRATAEQAGAFAQTLGFTRVANLIQVIAQPDDAVIERLAERELTIHRGFDGCRFHVESQHGVLRVGGRIRSDIQKDMAIQLLRNIDGVKEVHAELLRR